MAALKPLVAALEHLSCCEHLMKGEKSIFNVVNVECDVSGVGLLTGKKTKIISLITSAASF